MITGNNREVHLGKLSQSYWDTRTPLSQIHSHLWVENSRNCSPPLSKKDIDMIVMKYRPIFSPISAASIMQSDIVPTEWIIDEFLPQGLFFIAGRKGIGKSWLSFQLSVSVVNGNDFLGIYPCHSGNVLYCALEDTLSRVKDRISRYTIRNPEKFHCVLLDELPRMFSGGLMLLKEYLERTPACRLIILDTLARFRSSSGSSRNLYQDDYDTIGYLQSFAMEHKIAFVVVHHLNKGTHFQHEIDSISGTVGVIGSADGLYLLREKGKFVNMYSMGRDIREQNIALNLNRETMQWEYLGDPIIFSQSDSRNKIYEFVSKSPVPVTATEISMGIGKVYSTIHTLLGKMVKEGVLKKMGETYMKADPKTFYSPFDK